MLKDDKNGGDGSGEVQLDLVGLSDNGTDSPKSTDELASAVANARAKAALLQNRREQMGRLEQKHKMLESRSDQALYEVLASAYAVLKLVQANAEMLEALEREGEERSLPRPKGRNKMASLVLIVLFGDLERRVRNTWATVLIALNSWGVAADRGLDQIQHHGVRKLIQTYRADRQEEGEVFERRRKRIEECQKVEEQIAALGDQINLEQLGAVLKDVPGKFIIRAKIVDGRLSEVRLSS